MCFSAEASLVGGAVVTALGIDSLRHVAGRRELLGIAALPIVFGTHHVIEAFVWWGLQGHIPAGVGEVATWAYLLIAFVVIPVYVPSAVFALERPGWRRTVIGGLIALGTAVAAVLFARMLNGPVTAALEPWHLHYSIGLDASVPVVGAYVVAACGALLFSRHAHLIWFGAVNLLVVSALAALLTTGVVSLWCAWAAVTSAAVALHIRSTEPTGHVAAPVAAALGAAGDQRSGG